jgi:hypothetical protein
MLILFGLMHAGSKLLFGFKIVPTILGKLWRVVERL